MSSCFAEEGAASSARHLQCELPSARVCDPVAFFGSTRASIEECMPIVPNHDLCMKASVSASFLMQCQHTAEAPPSPDFVQRPLYGVITTSILGYRAQWRREGLPPAHASLKLQRMLA